MPKVKYATQLKPVDTAPVDVLQYRAKANTAAIHTTTTETSILGAAADGTNVTIPAGRISQVGSVIKWKLYVRIANTGTPNITVQVKLGSDVLWTSGTIAMSAITGTKSLVVEGSAVVTTAGSAAVIEAAGTLAYGVTGVTHVAAANDSTQLTAIDLTAAKTLAATLTWGTSDVANTATGKAGSEIYISPIGN